jgi:hypothetical protein
MVLSDWEPRVRAVILSQGGGTANGRVQFDRLLRFLEEFYASPGRESEGENLEFKGLRNRRWIWINCERILKEKEAQSSSGSGYGEQVKQIMGFGPYPKI